MMTLKVNGRDHQIDADPDTPLLYVLRDEIKLNAAKFGCGLGQCGACTVMVDGEIRMRAGVLAGFEPERAAAMIRASRQRILG